MSEQRVLYRRIVREVGKASVQPRQKRNNEILRNFRVAFQQRANSKNSQEYAQDVENFTTFLSSNTQYKTLMERYNPLFDLTAEERIEATARRVGLNMPKTAEKSEHSS